MPTTAGHILSTFLFFLLFVPVLFREAEGERPSTEDESCGHHQCHVYCGTDCAEGLIPAPAPRGREAMTFLPHMLSPCVGTACRVLLGRDRPMETLGVGTFGRMDGCWGKKGLLSYAWLISGSRK